MPLEPAYVGVHVAHVASVQADEGLFGVKLKGQDVLDIFIC